MRVLVDTNIWIDHLRKTEPVLVDLLERDQVCVHQSVITELALGNLKNRSFFLKMLERLMIVRNVDDQGGPASRRGAAAVGQGAQCCRRGAPGKCCRNPRCLAVDAR